MFGLWFARHLIRRTGEADGPLGAGTARGVYARLRVLFDELIQRRKVVRGGGPRVLYSLARAANLSARSAAEIALRTRWPD